MDTKLQKELTQAARDMQRAKSLIDEGEALKKGVKERILPLMAAYDIKSHTADGVGTVGLRTGKSSSISRSKLTEVLLREGFPAERIPALIDEAVTGGTYQYVEFRVWKEGQGS